MVYERLISKKEKIAIVGMGYVGMPIAVAFSKKLNVIGYDLNKQKIDLYKSGIDPTKEVGDEVIKNCNVYFTSNESRLKEAKFQIIAVPTPVYSDFKPNLKPVKQACEIVGKNLSKGSIVVFESTVYPGVTEEICIPILEKMSGLKCGVDFKVGYSPERINPGDKVHKLDNIKKIVSGMDHETLEEVAKTYELVVKAGVYKADSIKVAEAAKVVENSQRDINIAFMNEISIILNKMNIDTKEVLKAAGTKWNFLNFVPGLVGGHCIGVDPYYFIYSAEKLGYHSKVMLAGRRINDSMASYVSEVCIKKLIKSQKVVKGAKVAILGFSFKENCPDIRNSQVYDIYRCLYEFGVTSVITDPMADTKAVKKIYDISMLSFDQVKDVDAIIVAVGHEEYKKLSVKEMDKLYKDDKKILLDVKFIFNREEFKKNGYDYWSL